MTMVKDLTGANRIIESIHDKLVNLTSDEQVYTFSPVFHRYIGMHSGVKMYGKFYTNDSSEEGIMSYATFWRNENYPVPHDGVGLAWRKGDGTTYNVYVIDNNPLNQNVFITNAILREDVGINNYIGAGKFNLQPDTWYWFSIKLVSDNSIVAKIWSGTKQDEPLDGAAPNSSHIIIPIGARALAFREGNEQDYQIGFGVENTKGYIWQYDDIEVIAIESGFPYSIFKYKADPTTFTGPFTLKYYGYGVDENLTYGANLYLLDSSNVWNLVGSNTSTDAADVLDTEIVFSESDVSLYRQEDGYIYVAARPLGSYGQKNLYTYYTSLENVLAEGIHTGNAVDIWINAPTRIVETSVEVNSVSGVITVSDVNFSTPIQEIISLVDSASTELSTSDWTMTTEPGSAFTTTPVQYITLGGSYAGVNETFTITYRYYIDGASMQTTVESEEFRSPGASNKIKIMPPHAVQIDNLRYRGPLSVDQVSTYLQTFVHSITNGVLEITDMISYLYNQGVTYIDLDSLVIVVRGYNYKNINITGNGETVTSSYSISGLGEFYLGATDIGVTKLG
jgi:hypothetical protein